MELKEILEIENYIKQVILDNANKKEYFTTKDFINLFKKDKVNKYIYFKQSVNNVLSNLYKQDLIYRIKKGVYSFSDDFLKLRLSIENKENKEYIFNDIYHRYLLEKTTAVPNLNNTYISEKILNGYSKQTIFLFFDLYKNIGRINFDIENKNQRLLFELFLYFVLLDSSKIKNKLEYFVSDKNLYLFFVEKYKSTNIGVKDLLNIKDKLKIFLKNKKRAEYYYDLILKIIKGIEIDEKISNDN
ncbi:hypothetical protein [Malacoplasma iowae]|uniref:DUF1814 superfamily protein n=1 Tax=Malacoplasma iowae DK-CPA TaxID=1394179 RepID=A0A084U4R0_MALIO|nr:hypothetical protein [Malacoplasma iowae]KFB07946.1 DUF1814 superfamily protein [Malacoplasma iowae DK-CPA]WPL36689.1 hypothetical protein QX179_04680 [Malacoplasma iowae]WPL37906.1 hypothetical protein QX182_00045 [Malacoplasma iowae]WPL41302.1 hypothetical protein QX184_01730 [Malacoplasma iowae]